MSEVIMRRSLSDTKKCSICKEAFPRTEEYFYYARAKDGFKYALSGCRPCHKSASNKRGRELYHKNPEKTQNRIMWRKYGTNLLDYALMLLATGNKCTICGQLETAQHTRNKNKKSVLSIDHCHKTGRVRGVLCQNCNHGIGNFRDDPGLLQKAIDYLKKSNEAS